MNLTKGIRLTGLLLFFGSVAWTSKAWLDANNLEHELNREDGWYNGGDAYVERDRNVGFSSVDELHLHDTYYVITDLRPAGFVCLMSVVFMVFADPICRYFK